MQSPSSFVPLELRAIYPTTSEERAEMAGHQPSGSTAGTLTRMAEKGLTSERTRTYVSGHLRR